ncbi:MAG TPA: DUF624 domain-containing protein [Clostridiales bacterium]|nr:DUF624 domain-containing protein [Clostridiales bacterium]
MFGGFFNRMYYGDPRRPDLKKEDVKGSRIKIFFTVLSIRFWQLIQLNLLYSIFWIPTYFLLQAHAIMFVETKDFNSAAFFLMLIPCLVITGPATAGVTYVIRNWARDEHAWVWSDFKDAWKANWKQSLLMMLINGVVIYLFSINLRFYYINSANNGLFFYLFCFMIMLSIMYAMMNMFIFPMMVTYKLNLRQIIRNAFILTMVKLPFTFLILVLAVALVYITFIYLFSLPFFVVGLTFPAFIVISYVNWIFDKYINNRIMDEDKTASDEELES